MNNFLTTNKILLSTTALSSYILLFFFCEYFLSSTYTSAFSKRYIDRRRKQRSSCQRDLRPKKKKQVPIPNEQEKTQSVGLTRKVQ